MRLPGWRNLEAEACSHRDDSGGKSARNSAEVSVVNVVRDVIRVKVHIIEQVVGIDSELNLGVLAEDRHVGQSERFGE